MLNVIEMFYIGIIKLLLLKVLDYLPTALELSSIGIYFHTISITIMIGGGLSILP